MNPRCFGKVGHVLGHDGAEPQGECQIPVTGFNILLSPLAGKMAVDLTCKKPENLMLYLKYSFDSQAL